MQLQEQLDWVTCGVTGAAGHAVWLLLVALSEGQSKASLLLHARVQLLHMVCGNEGLSLWCAAHVLQFATVTRPMFQLPPQLLC